MEHPVFAADGYTYERRNIEDWLKSTNESPITKEVLAHRNLVPNHQLHGEIEVPSWLVFLCSTRHRADFIHLQSWKELNDGSCTKGDTEVIPLVGAARKGKVKGAKSWRRGDDKYFVLP